MQISLITYNKLNYPLNHFLGIKPPYNLLNALPFIMAINFFPKEIFQIIRKQKDFL